MISEPSSSNASPEPNDARWPFADSPAPWVLAFGAAALIGLLAIAPKHRARQARLERMAQTRDGIWYDPAEWTPPAEAGEPIAQAGPTAQVGPIAQTESAEQPGAVQQTDDSAIGPDVVPPLTAAPPAEDSPEKLAEGAIEVGDPPPEPGVAVVPARRTNSPAAMIVALSIAAVAAGMGLLSYLRSVSRVRPPRNPRSDA